MKILSLMLKAGKIGHIERITMPKALLLPCWPAIPLVSKVLVSFSYLWLIADCHASPQLTC
jgi:hypothetical protein